MNAPRCGECGKLKPRVPVAVERRAYELREMGLTIREVGLVLGVSRKTAWKYTTRYAEGVK